MAHPYQDHIRICKIHNIEKHREACKNGNKYKFNCKLCASERSRRWRDENQDRYKKQNQDAYIKRMVIIEENKRNGIEQKIEMNSDIPCKLHNINKIYDTTGAIICRECKKEYTKKYRQKNPGKKYGLTAEEFYALYEQANNKCGICNKPESRMFNGKVVRLSIDHKHDETQKVRGILCTKCNAMIGHADESIEILKSGIQWLEKHAE